MASGARRGGGRGGASALKPHGLTYMEGAHLEEMYMDSDIKAAPVLDPPSEKEQQMAALQLDIIRSQWDSPYWTQYIPKRMDDEPLMRYTDRYQPDRRGAASAASFLQQVPLQKEVFPSHLWDSFTSSETRRMARRAEPTARMRTKATIDWDNLHMEEKKTGEGEEELPPDSDEEDLGDYEDEDDDDYAQNYFDNGEDDDDIDADGGGGDEAAFD